MENVYLSIGSNLGDRMANLRLAIRYLGEVAEIAGLSHAYESEPVEYTAQPFFLNAALALRVNGTLPEYAPEPLLGRLLAIEQEMGRRRDGAAAVPKGPRIIDLDMVLYGSRVIDLPQLTVPHPAMHLRRFVLEPLAEIAPEVEHPLLHQSVRELLQALPQQGPSVRRFATLD